MPPPGKTPTRACVSPNFADWAATRRSHWSASSSPPVTAAPLIAPITGFDIGCHVPPPGAHGPVLAPSGARFSPLVPSSFRSRPAQNAGPDAGENDDVHVVAFLGAGHCHGHRPRQFTADRVASLRTIECDGGDPVRHVEQHDAVLLDAGVGIWRRSRWAPVRFAHRCAPRGVAVLMTGSGRSRPRRRPARRRAPSACRRRSSCRPLPSGSGRWGSRCGAARRGA